MFANGTVVTEIWRKPCDCPRPARRIASKRIWSDGTRELVATGWQCCGCGAMWTLSYYESDTFVPREGDVVTEWESFGGPLPPL